MSSHLVSPWVYLAVFGLLVGLTALTVAAAFQDLGAWSTPVALLIALGKATLIALYFMHLRWGARLDVILFVAGLLWLALLLGFTAMDFATRREPPVYVDDPPAAFAEMAPR